MLDRAPKRLAKKAKHGFRGYPVATVALYGPDDSVVHGSALELWKAFERFELFSVTIRQA